MTAVPSIQEPPNAQDVRQLVEERLNALSPGTRETVTVEWRGETLPIDVVTLPVSVLTLNPDTHRIRAQRTIDPAGNAAIQSDPYGLEAQQYIQRLLKANPSNPDQVDPSFEALKEDLETHGQDEPGIITRSGVLVNGNTRCAALRELGKQNIRVAVLPPDASADDVRAVELSLQMRRDMKRDYSFVNLLLAIHEQVDSGLAIKDILAAFRIQHKTLNMYEWILALIYEAIDRSRYKQPDGTVTQLQLIDFETDKGKLEELYRAYSTAKESDPNEAEEMREARLLALILDHSKTDLRLVGAGFADRYLSPLLPEAKPQTTAAIPGLPDVTLPAAEPRVQQVRALVDQVLRARAAEKQAPLRQADIQREFLQTLRVKMEDGLDHEGKSARLKKRVVLPGDRISDAAETLGQAIQALVDARAGRSGIKVGDIEEAVSELRTTVIQLARQVNRLVDPGVSTGDGVAWLLEAAQAGQEK